MSVLQRMRWTALVMVCLGASLSCSRPQLETPLPPVMIRIAGSTSMEPLLRMLTDAYGHEKSHVQFDIQGVGTAAGLELLRRQAVDVASVSRPLYFEEANAQSGQSKLNPSVAAWDGIAVIVHPSVRLDDLSLYGVRQLFEGRIVNWLEVDLESSPVQVVSREDGSGTRQAFEEQVMQNHWVTPAAVVMPSSVAVRDYVAEHREAIGYLSMGLVDASVKVVAIDGIVPTRDTVAKGLYSLVRPMLLVASPSCTRETQAFVQWVQSAAGQAVVSREYATASAY